MTKLNEYNSVPAVPQGVPGINYPALIEAAFTKNRKWTQGTTGCIAFARGAEWFREQAIAATSAPAQEVGLIACQFDLICQAIDKADTATMEVDYMLDSDDCIAVVRVMQALFDIAALRAKGGK